MAENSVLKLDPVLEKSMNEQINAEFNAFYAYQALYNHFNRHDVALINTASFFKKSSEEEVEHANKLICYINKRGGTVELQDIKAISITSITMLAAFELALSLELAVHKRLLAVHDIAAQVNDCHVMDFLEGEFLTEQVDAEDGLMRIITNIKRTGPGLGEYLSDKDIPH